VTTNSASREEIARLAGEHAALHRVATLVARGVPQDELFSAVVGEAGVLFGADLAGMIRYVTDQAVTPVATWAAEGQHPEVTGDWPLDGDQLATTILGTRRPAREDHWGQAAGPIATFVHDRLGVRSSVGCPVVVEDRVWGALFVHSTSARALSGDTESRLMAFTELVATAIANSHARGEVRRLVAEQAALRRVATLVARERPPSEVFAAVAEEVARILEIEDARVLRYEADGTVTVMASWGTLGAAIPVGTRWTLEGENVSTMVRRTGRVARKDYYDDASGRIGDRVRDLGVRSAVGTPIVVEGRLWGAMLAASFSDVPLPADAEARIGEFTELVATAIANVEARAELAASRARIMTAADEERRRVVRDLHDGAQQRLMHTVVTLKMAAQAAKDDAVAELVQEALEEAEGATVELREFAHGILPAALTRRGLAAGVELLAERAPVPVEVDVAVPRLPPPIEATAYFVIAEALTNVAKHARASRVCVEASAAGGRLRVEVRDDGVGGARTDGSGLVGLHDRLAAFDGRLEVDSPPGRGTRIAAEIPLPTAAGT